MNLTIAHWAQIWGKPPDAQLDGIRTGVSAALWSSERSMKRSFYDCVPEINTVAMLLRGQNRLESYHGNKFTYGRQRVAGQVTISVAGNGGQRKEIDSVVGLSMLHVYLPQRFLSDIAAVESLAGSGDAVELVDAACANDRQIQYVGQELAAELSDVGALTRLRLDCLGQDLAIRALRVYSNLAGTQRLSSLEFRGGLAQWRLALACGRMMASVEDGLEEPSLVDLAALVGLTPTHFCRAFAQSKGVPPHRWLTERRIERAQTLMSADPHRNLTKIASDVGFTTQDAFARAFRRIAGTAPSAWRDSL